nr:hypothetical protein [Tanacetum cinerariifolium]
LRGACLCWGEWERACRSSGSGGEGSRNRGEGGVESGEKNGLNSNSNLNVGKKGIVWGFYTIGLCGYLRTNTVSPYGC